jgi:hypothetical protein
MSMPVAEKKMAITMESLVYWESPAHSAAVFLPTLAVFAALSARYIYSGLKGTVARDGFFDHTIVSKIWDKDFIYFFSFLSNLLHLAYSESAPRFFNNLRGLNRVNVSTM